MATEATSSANLVMRAALIKMDPAHVVELVDQLDLRANAKVSPVVGVPLRQLQQRRDVEAFAANAPLAAVRGLLEVMALTPLERVIELLGDQADSPSFDELAAAIDAFLDEGGSLDDALAVLAFAIGEDFPAAAHCRRLLHERDVFELPDVPEGASASVLAAPREVRPEVREQRRQRREEEKKKRLASAARAPRRARPKSVTPPRVAARPSPSPVNDVTERRRAKLTPLEESRFDPAHRLAGSLVLLEVPFDALDPDQPDVTSKERPALVVAATEDAVLVRALYSSDAPTRSIFSPWRRVGLDHPSFIEDARVIVTCDATTLRPLAQLRVSEWNALF